MHVGHIEIFVTDPAAASSFYEHTLGFTVTAVQGQKFVWLSSGEREFLLRPGRVAPPATTYQECATAIVLYTAHLDETMAELRGRGVTFEGTNGSEKCPTFRDPDGNWFQLVNPEDH